MTSHRILDTASRADLIQRAHELNVERPERMTRAELRDEIIRLTEAEADQAARRGLFGVARSMLASVVEAGLKMPDAATVIRGDSSIAPPAASRTPVATVTLAEIYVAQGHRTRARTILEQILQEEPDHLEAQRVLRELNEGPEAEPADESDSAASARSSSAAPLATTSKIGAFGQAEVSPASSAVAVGRSVETLETTGQEIKTGEPPAVEERESVPSPEPTRPAEPVAAKPVAAEPAPVAAESTPAEPVAAESTPAEPVAAEPAPAEPVAAESTPAAPVIVQDASFLLTSDAPRVYYEVSEVTALRLQSATGPAPQLCLSLFLVSSQLGVVRTESKLLQIGPLSVADLSSLSGVIDLSKALEPDLLTRMQKAKAVRAAVGVEGAAGFLPLSVCQELSPEKMRSLVEDESSQPVWAIAYSSKAKQRALRALNL